MSDQGGTSDSDVVPFIVFPTGLPASGKTSVGISIARELQLPMLRSDTIKEALFDSIGFGTLAWSEFLSTVVVETAFRLLPQIGPCVFDVFMPFDVARERLPRYVGEILEVHCSLPYEVAWERFVDRARSGTRHPGHLDTDISLDHYRSTLVPQQVDEPFEIDGVVFQVDTLREFDLQPVTDWLRKELSWPYSTEIVEA